jgi:glutamate synthase (NADPH/NADH) small chain
VIGGGNTAIDAANAAHLLGADEVHMLYRRSEKEMPAFPFEYKHAKQHRIRFHWLTLPLAIQGGERVTGVECLRTELGSPDKTGRRQPEPIEGSNFTISCDMVIPALGQTRLLPLLEQLRGVELCDGRVVTNAATGQTKNPKYFAGGDCVNGGREVVDAVADGKRAGQGIAAWLT